MDVISLNNFFFSMFISPEELARYTVVVFFAILNLLVTYFILKKFLFRPTIKFLDKKKEKLQNEIDEAKRIKTDADRKYRDASERLETAIHEAGIIVEDAKNQAEKQRESIISEARKKSAEIIERTEQEISAMKKAMVRDMQDDIADLSVKVASRVIGSSLNPAKQNNLARKYLEDELSGKED